MILLHFWAYFSLFFLKSNFGFLDFSRFFSKFLDFSQKISILGSPVNGYPRLDPYESGGIFGAISDRLWKIKNLKVQNLKIDLKMTSNRFKNQ